MIRKDLQLALKNKNVLAFLKAIRLGEGTLEGGDEGYYRIVGGGTFQDTSKHPNIRVWIPRYNVYSSAAGAYQFIFRTWQSLCKQYGFTDFEPETQDEGAVALIAEKGALNNVIFGELKTALHKCAPVWASLPDSKAGQRTEKYEAIEKVYLTAGGSLS